MSTSSALASADRSVHAASALGWSLAAVSGLLGLFLSLALLSGDAQGRVNLIYLLALYVGWPLLALASSLLLLVFGRRAGAPALLSGLRMWPESWTEAIHQMSRRGLLRSWLFIRSQMMAMAFSGGILAGFFLMLLATDINFVWRSTLLQAEDVQPLLEILALPWQFWPSAQPSIELLQATRDFRLADTHGGLGAYGQWWRYLFMAQLVYALLPRAVLLSGAQLLFTRQLRTQREDTRLEVAAARVNEMPRQPRLPATVSSIDEPYALLNLLRSDAEETATLLRGLGSPIREFQTAPLHELEQDEQLLRYRDALLVVVNAMEPPMGELADLLCRHRGYLLPVRQSSRHEQGIPEPQLDEWRRFASSLEAWSVVERETPR